MEGELHVVTVRSQRASASLAGVELPDLPAGVVAILARDIPGRPTLVWGEGSHPILASGEVRYVGEPVALVAARELEVARGVAAEVGLRYADDAPPGSDPWVPESSTLRGEAGEPQTMDESTGLEHQIVTRPRRFAPPSPQEVIAHWDGQILVLRTATRDPFHVRETVAAVLDMPQGKVRVIGEALDGPAGKHLMPSLVAAHAALVCFVTGRPVRVRYTWPEELGAAFRVAGTLCRWQVGDRGARLHLAVEGGAYDPMAGEVLRRALSCVPGPYRAARMGLTAEYHFTRTVPCELPPGCGELEATLVREMWVSAEAARLGIDPATHRLELLGGVVDEDGGGGPRRPRPQAGWGAREVIREVVRRSGFHRRYAACAAAAERRGEDTSIPHRGIGIALATFRGGFGDPRERGSRLRLAMGRDRRVTIHTSAVDAGRGCRALYARIVAEVLGVEPSSVLFAPVDTQSVPDTGATAASRTATILVPLLRRCAAQLKRRTARGALPVSVESSYSPPPGRGHEGSAATVATVEMDPQSGAVRCTGVWAVIDAGEVLDLRQARTVAAASVVRGLGIATLEQSEAALVPIPPASSPYAAPPPAYHVAGIADIPAVEVEFLDHGGDRLRPAPVGISELAILGVPAAVASATGQAQGRPVTRLPIGAETLA